MRKGLRLLALSLLLSNSIYSQSLLVIDGDTLAVMPIALIQKANVKFLQCDSIRSELTFQQQINQEMCGQIANYKLNEVDYQQSITLLNGIIATQDSLKRKELYQLEQKVKKYRIVTAGSILLFLLALL